MGGATCPPRLLCREVALELARMCLPVEQQPRFRAHLLLARWIPSGGGGEFDLLLGDKLETKAADAFPTQPSGSAVFTLRGPRAAHLLAYRYSNAGPDSDRARPVIIHHRSGYTGLLPPSVLFVEEDVLAGIRFARAEGGTINLSNEQALDVTQSIRQGCCSIDIDIDDNPYSSLLLCLSQFM